TTRLNNKRSRSQVISSSNKSKKQCLIKTSDSILSSTPPPPPRPPSTLPIVNNPDEHLFRKPLVTYNNLPPITIEQLL
ncbi:unnamed protein product, partial [Rotaria magnacalcarata]